MERVKEYLSSVKIPSYEDVKSGEYFRSFLRPLDQTDNTSYIKDFENYLVYLQEVVLWSNVGASLAWLVVSQLILYQFCLSSTPLISSTAYVCLLSYLYITWTQRIWPTIKLPSQHTEDDEKFTSVHPDTLSAPEMENISDKIRQKCVEVYGGLWLMREEAPLMFCLSMSSFFITTAFIGTKVSTPLLIHGVALSAFALPQALLQLNKDSSISPTLLFIGEVFGSLVNLIIYRGEHFKPQESTELDDFMPEANSSNLEKLDITVKSSNNDQEDSLNMLLAPDQNIPSHDEVDLLAADNPDLEADLLPCSRIEHDVSDEDDIEGPVGELGGVEDSDTDSADGAFSLATSVATAISSYIPSVTDTAALLPAVTTQVLENLVQTSLKPERNKRATSEPDLEDFELISEDELQAESP